MVDCGQQLWSAIVVSNSGQNCGQSRWGSYSSTWSKFNGRTGPWDEESRSSVRSPKRNLCKRHHQMVHEGGWQLIKTQEGETVSIAPTITLRLAEGTRLVISYSSGGRDGFPLHGSSAWRGGSRTLGRTWEVQ